MSAERRILIHIPAGLWSREFVETARLADQAARRAKKAAPGDRREADRYASYCSAVEQRTRALLVSGDVLELANWPGQAQESLGNSWWTSAGDALAAIPEASGAHQRIRDAMEGGGGLVELVEHRGLPVQIAGLPPAGPIPGAEDAWRPEHGETGLAAVKLRWESQLRAASRGNGVPIVPSGVSNRVLTEGLRKFVDRSDELAPIIARVVYRDGSEGPGFPLRSVELTSDEDPSWPQLNVALMSMRHPEMDGDVDMCWLRNRDVSRTRAAAETDRFVFETSRAQLSDLAAVGPLTINLFQTGLEPALTGFFRALTMSCTEGGADIAVRPQYFRANGRFEEGTLWKRA